MLRESVQWGQGQLLMWPLLLATFLFQCTATLFTFSISGYSKGILELVVEGVY